MHSRNASVHPTISNSATNNLRKKKKTEPFAPFSYTIQISIFYSGYRRQPHRYYICSLHKYAKPEYWINI